MGITVDNYHDSINLWIIMALLAMNLGEVDHDLTVLPHKNHG